MSNLPSVAKGAHFRPAGETRSILRRFLHCVAVPASFLACAAAHAGYLPRVTGVTFTEAGDGSYSAVISGLHFGAAPASVPCQNCRPAELQIRRTSDLNEAQTMNVTKWTDTEIDVSALPVVATDAVDIAVYNRSVAQAAAWGGLVVRGKLAPRIHHIATSGSGIHLTVTITGRGFGPAPSAVGGQGYSPFLAFSDFNARAPGTDGFPWNAGFCGATSCDRVSMNYVSWSDTKIVLGGFGDQYGLGNWVSRAGDAICVAIWPGTSTTDGTTGGTAKCRRLTGK